MKDKLRNDVKVGDYILVYDVNHMNVTRVKEIVDDYMFIPEDDLTYKSYNASKCVVINSQREYIINNFPERLI